MKSKVTLHQFAYLLTGLIIVGFIFQQLKLGQDFWSSPDQRAQRMLDRGNFEGAAKVFTDPFRRGIAEYLAGDFKQSASTFTGLPDDNSRFNQANAFMMLGRYEDAINAYDQVIASKPDRGDAIINREIAIGRAERVKDNGGQMTDGQLGADEIVFDQAKNNGGEQVTVEAEAMSDSEMRLMWLRQVETTPSDFLRSKFAFQRGRQQEAAETANE